MPSKSPTTSIVSTPFTMEDAYTRLAHTHNTSFKFNDTSTGNITCDSDFASRYRTFREVVNIYLSSAVIIFGLIGNIASFYALHRMTSSSCLILKVLAIMDSLYLLLHTYTTVYDEIAHSINGIGVVLLHYYPLERILQTANAWVTVLLTIDRYLAVMKPLHTKLIFTEKRIKLSIFLICVLAISLHVPMFFEYTYEGTYNDCGLMFHVYDFTYLLQDDYYQICFHVIVEVLIRLIIPLTLLIILNSRMAMAIYKARERRSVIMANSIASGQRQSETMTAMVVVVVTIFAICQTPYMIYTLDFLVTWHNLKFFSYETNLYWLSVGEFFLLLNSSVNCLIYVVFGKTFRQKLFSCCRRRSIELA